MFSPTRSSPSGTTQLTDARAVASGAQRSTSRATDSLCGIVTDKPPRPSARIPSSAPATPAGATSNAKYSQSNPSVSNAEFTIAGDNERVDG